MSLQAACSPAWDASCRPDLQDMLHQMYAEPANVNRRE